MSFNSTIVKNYASGTLVAMQSPLTAVSGSQIALNTKVAGSNTSTAGLVLQPGGSHNIELDSLTALVETKVTTNTIVVTTRWEVSNDGTNWIPIYQLNAPAYVAVAAAGTGATVYTQYVQSAAGINPSWPYIRLAAVNTVVTGGANDSVIVAYNWRRRFVSAVG